VGRPYTAGSVQALCSQSGRPDGKMKATMTVRTPLLLFRKVAFIVRAGLGRRVVQSSEDRAHVTCFERAYRELFHPGSVIIAGPLPPKTS
jgi:hypothetical protein